MIKEEIEILKKRLSDEINTNCDYKTIYNTSVEIDKLLIKYYNKYGLLGQNRYNQKKVLIEKK